MNLQPSNLEALRSVLTELAQRKPASPEEFRAHQSCCLALARHLATASNIANELPEIVWHWLSDADIRFKEPEYRAVQDQLLALALGSWERQGAA